MMSYLILLVVVFFLGEKRQRIAPLKYDTYAQNALGPWLFFTHIIRFRSLPFSRFRRRSIGSL